MKRSPDYYHNRKLLRELKDDKVKYRPKVADMEIWFTILNEQIFGNKLRRVKKFQIKPDDERHAYYAYYDKKHKKYGKTRIVMDNKFSSKKRFVEILAHEMIHHFQAEYDEPVGHGPTFTAWRENFKVKGINLYKV
jgi:hypothetical protein